MVQKISHDDFQLVTGGLKAHSGLGATYSTFMYLKKCYNQGHGTLKETVFRALTGAVLGELSALAEDKTGSMGPVASLLTFISFHDEIQDSLWSQANEQVKTKKRKK